MSPEEKVIQSRPVAEGVLNIADTFQDAETRPIKASSDLLIENNNQLDNAERKDDFVDQASQNKINKEPPLD
ncbi:MAG: hypothetical protein AAGE84_28555 [Cyanobacteria bacterium P01_G01_bin.39]